MCYILHVTDRQADKETEMEFETVFQMGNSVPQILVVRGPSGSRVLVGPGS